MPGTSRNPSELALNTATLGHNLDGAGMGWPVERVIDACALRGFGGITFWRREIGRDAHRIGARVCAAGMEVAGLCRAPYLVGPHAAPTRRAVLDDFEAAIAMAQALGAPVLTIVTGGIVPGSRSMRESLVQVTEIVAEMAPRAEAAGVVLALEPLHPVYAGDRSCLVRVADALAICDAIGSASVKIAVDVYHVWWDLALAEDLARAGTGRVAGFHLCDWLAQTRDVLLDRGMMGDGVADLRGIAAAVAATGYDGVHEVEIFSAQDWWRRPPDEVLDTVVDRFRTWC